ncbi:MAG: PorT family protein, partial [Paramuribaculum sp.]|nr:PorT family protein [Paramuribaculum sp.]
QFRIGPKIGVNVNKLSSKASGFSAENRAGFNAGLMTEFTVPVIGIGVDLSVMYVRRNDKFTVGGDSENMHRDYIDIPLNLKYKLNIPLINNIVRPFLTTGPSFAFLTNKRSFNDFRNKKSDVAWNFGLGVEFVKHLQIGASYGFGLNKVTGNSDSKIDGKNKYWTVTAAYLF